MLSPSMTPTTFPDHAAVAGDRTRASAKSHGKILMCFPSLLSCDRPGSHLRPSHAPWSRSGKCDPGA